MNRKKNTLRILSLLFLASILTAGAYILYKDYNFGLSQVVTLFGCYFIVSGVSGMVKMLYDGTRITYKEWNKND